MTEDQKKKLLQELVDTLTPVIKDSIGIFVNGKVDGMREELQTYIALDQKWKVDDKLWKDNATPVVDLYKKTTFWSTWAGKKIINLLKLIILVGAAVGAWNAIQVSNFFNK